MYPWGSLLIKSMMGDSFLRKVRSELLDGFKTTKTSPSEGSYEETRGTDGSIH